MIRNFFTEKDNTVSWRKIMTCGALFCFMTAVIGFLATHNFEELPNNYQVIIGGVFVFYFGKNFLSNVKATKTE